MGGCLGFSVGTVNWIHVSMFKKDGKKINFFKNFNELFSDLGGEFSVIFYIATILFFICTISTLTSVREEPLISSSSSRDKGDIENSNDDDDDDDKQPEIEVDEKRPLLSARRNKSRSYNSSNKPVRSRANKYFSDLNKQEGFVEIDPATGERIPYDHEGEKTSETILLKTFQSPHQVAVAQVSNSDPFNPTTVQTQEFDAELQHKAKLVKLGIQSFLTSSIHFLLFIIKVLCDVLNLKTIMIMMTKIM